MNNIGYNAVEKKKIDSCFFKLIRIYFNAVEKKKID